MAKSPRQIVDDLLGIKARPSTEFDDLLGGEEKKVNFNVTGSPDSVPTIFADTAIFAYRFGGTVRIQFVEALMGAADSPKPGFVTRHVFNLVIPAEGFANMLQYLNGIAEGMELPAPASDGQATDGN